jgi:hypothetical protein
MVSFVLAPDESRQKALHLGDSVESLVYKYCNLACGTKEPKPPFDPTSPTDMDFFTSPDNLTTYLTSGQSEQTEYEAPTQAVDGPIDAQHNCSDSSGGSWSCVIA